MKELRLLVSVVALSALTAASADVVVENERFKLVLGDNARPKSLVVKATGEEMLDPAEDIPAFSVIQERPFNNEVKLVFPHRRTEFRANRVRREGDDLFVGFELVSYEARIRLCERPDYVLFELVDFLLGPKGANDLQLTYSPIMREDFTQLDSASSTCSRTRRAGTSRRERRRRLLGRGSHCNPRFRPGRR